MRPVARRVNNFGVGGTTAPTGTLPGTCNLEHPDPAIDLHLLRAATPARPEAALSNSFGFGG